MWHLENWDVIILVSLLCGFLLLYNTWGSALTVAALLCCVSYVYCYYLASLENGPLSTPNVAVLVFLDHLKKLTRKSYFFLKHLATLIQYYVNYSIQRSLGHLKRQSATAMEKRSRFHYQLSRDSYTCGASTSNTAEFNRINELSPILRKRRDNGDFPYTNRNEFENISYRSNVTPELYNNIQDNFARKQTSTPILPRRHESDSKSNSDVNVGLRREVPDCSYSLNSLTTKDSEGYQRRENNVSNESRESCGNSFKGTGNLKMRLKANGVKSMHTVAGPLLMSTRYNIDSKIFLNASSPGLTSRVTQYAAENTDKFNYQSQYSTGQFPKINFNAKPTPLISPTLAKSRTPVTVRLAPPETTKCSPDRKKILSDLYAAENERPPTVVQVLREISLKRHASSEDIASDIVKKQRTVGVCNGDLENLGETTQKRSRDDSLRSDDDGSPQHKAIRPLKRSKAQSCYDILNSLSSSMHVNSGVKRKAIDTSRSGTPDLQKHFKSLDNIQNESFRTPSRTSTTLRPRLESCTKNSVLYLSQPKDTSQNDKIDEQPPIRRLLGTNLSVDSMTPRSNARDSVQAEDISTIKYNSDRSTVAKKAQERVTDKLFMKAEPVMNDKFKTVIAEQDAIRPKFAPSEGDEIKKEDIVNMRQTSMRNRLESMFNVTTGQEANKINPDVVIQAEEVTTSSNTEVTSTTITPLATLNSSTIMTNVNTSPITTSAVAPILVVTKTDKKTPKHVTFSLPSAESVQTSVTDVSGTQQSLASSVENSINATTAPASVNSVSTLSSPISSIATTTSSCDQNSMGISTLKQSFVLPASSNVVPTFAASAGPAANVQDTMSNSNLNRIQSSMASPSTNSIASNNFKLPSFATAKSTENVQPTQSILTFGTSPSAPSNTMASVSTDTHSKAVSNGISTTACNNNSTVVCTPQTVFNSIANNQFTTIATTSTAITSGLFSSPGIDKAHSISKSQSVSFNNPVAMQGFASTGNGMTPSTLPSSNDAAVTTNFSFPTKPATSANTSFSKTSPALGVSNSTSPFTFGGSTSSLSTTLGSKNTFTFGKSTSTSLPSMTVAGSTSSAAENITTTTGFTMPSTGATGTFGTSATPLFSGISSNINFQANKNSGANGTLAQSTNNTTSAFVANGTSFTSSKPTSLFPAVSTSVATSNAPTVPTFMNNLSGFGQNKTITSQGTSTSANSPFGNSAPSFGNNSMLFPTSNNTTAPTFGSPSPAMAPASLGAGNSRGATSFNASNSFGLGSVSSPIFGTAASTNFGGTSTSFDTPGNAEAVFSTANNNTPAFSTSAFGSPAVTTSAPSIFGTSNSTSVFGATSNNNNSNAAFNFGVSSPPGQQSSGFSFGNNASTGNAAGISAPFQFGQNSTSKPSEGFNFTAPTSAPTINFGGTGTPTFNAPTPGMFNMGSGSTAPRSRTTRPRRQR